MITCRTATRLEVQTLLDWAAEEGWNPGQEDAAAFFAADHEGFFVAVDGAGAPLAGISVVNHSADYAFLGLYIVRPEYRGQGIGLRLWNHALRHAGGRVVGLDGVEAQQQNYQRAGFAYAGGTTRFTGSLEPVARADVRVADGADMGRLIEMEAEASGVAKPAYLGGWFKTCPTRVTYVMGPETLEAFCTIRACRSGAKIGPLVAQDAEMARDLILHAAARFDGPVTLDVPDNAQALTEVCRALGLQPSFKTARMYRGAALHADHSTFAVATLELG